jgi:hypothetical protein
VSPDELAGEVAAAASRLAQHSGDAEDPVKALYLVAGALGSLAAPLTALGGRTAETASAVEALREAERAVRAVQRRLEQGPVECRPVASGLVDAGLTGGREGGAAAGGFCGET